MRNYRILHFVNRAITALALLGLTVSPAPAESEKKIDIKESFDKAKKGGLPDGWIRWQSGGTGFEVTSKKSLSEPQALQVSGTSSTAARVWLKEAQPANIQVNASILVNTLIPAQVIVRGSGLDGPGATYYAVAVSRGMEIELQKVVKGKTTKLATLKSKGYLSEKWVRVTLQAEGKKLLARFCRLDDGTYLNGDGDWQATATWTLAVEDGEISAGGLIGVGRMARYAGVIYFDDFAASLPSNDAPAPVAIKAGANPIKPASKSGAPSLPATVPSPLPFPQIPRHYSHIRIALLAYAGNPMGPFEDRLLKESVDLVVPNVTYLKHIHAVAPETPQLIYTNTSNLYLELLTDWLNFADAHGYPREAAFYHVAKATPFKGDSPSSQPVTWFWGVYQGERSFTNLTAAAHNKKERLALGGAGDLLCLGYPDKFREAHFDLSRGAAGGWLAAMEYVNEVDGDGQPSSWRALTVNADGTWGFAQTGAIEFEPPADWKTASIGGSTRLYYVRIRTTRGGSAPIANTILGRDYVEAKGTTAGVIPAFDNDADVNKDGYLDDAEFAKRKPGKNARFFYESRFASEGYGQMRFCTSPSSEGFQKWAIDYNVRFLAKHPLAGGLFMDNSSGKPPVKPSEVLENVGTYSADYGTLLQGLSKTIAPKWVLANTAGGYANAEPVIQRHPTYMEEFAIRPMGHHFGFFEDLSTLVARRQALTNPPPLAVLDSHPQGGNLTDPRVQIGTLAYYYLLADPDSTFLMFYGGNEPNSSWKRHWTAAVAFDVGKPEAKWSEFASGADPSNPQLRYRIFQRPYSKALILYKPLSHIVGNRTPQSVGDNSATKHDLKGTYRPLGADGKLGAPVTSVNLRNGEGAILIKEK